MLLRALFYTLAVLLGISVFTRQRSCRARQLCLLIVSYALYVTWGAWFFVVLLASTGANFLVGRWMQRKPSLSLLWTGLAFNLLLLAVFKYLPGVAATVPLSSLCKFSHLALPLGISFWTFQAMSYLFDLYGGEKLDPSFLEFALYMVFFPIVISGPICRMPDMLPQFRSDRQPSRSDIWGGFSRIAVGVLMMLFGQLLGKGLVAGHGINAGFDQMAAWSGPDVWCLAVGYGMQLFLDFAGYSHIAIGVARMLGFTVPENFARPFTSITPSVFWTRWHMSLSFWIRDYVFMPMAMLRGEQWWWEGSLLISMVIFGVWHKGTLLLLLFGCYHGMLLIGHRRVQALRKHSKALMRKTTWGFAPSWLATAALISLGWIFFRANSLTQASQMFQALVSPASYADHFLSSGLYLLIATIAAGYALTLLLADFLGRYRPDESALHLDVIVALARDRWLWIAPIYFFATLAVLILVHHLPQNGPGPFMYAGY